MSDQDATKLAEGLVGFLESPLKKGEVQRPQQ